MLRKIIATGLTMSAFTTTWSQDSDRTSALRFSGSADLYYKYDFHRTEANGLTSFTRTHNRFEPGMLTARLDYTTPRVELVADLGFGKRATEFSYNDEGIAASIKQLSVSCRVQSWLKLTAGTWPTHVGYEGVDATSNRNYSTSYLFTNGPFLHTGLKADATWGAMGFMAGIANPTDYKYVPAELLNRKFLIAQYSYTAGSFLKVYLNYVSGKNVDTSCSAQYDLVLSGAFSDHLSWAGNASLARVKEYGGNKTYDPVHNWWGSAIYLNWDPLTDLGFTLREEYFRDGHRLKVFREMPAGGAVSSTTLSANWKIDKLTLIPEIRFDRATEALFRDEKNSPVKNAASALLAAVYRF